MILGIISLSALYAANLPHHEFTKGLIGNLLASLIENLESKVVNRGRIALATLSGGGPSLPKNHDLVRAERTAFGTALLALHAALLAKKSSFEPKHERWVGLLKALADDILAKAGDRESKGKFRYESWLMKVEAAGGGVDRSALIAAARASQTEGVKALVHGALDHWIRFTLSEDVTINPTVPPAVFGEWLSHPDGFEFHPPDSQGWFARLRKRGNNGQGMRIAVMDAWAQCFIEELKLKPRAFAAHLVESLDDLKGSFSNLAAQIEVLKASAHNSDAATFPFEARLSDHLALTDQRFTRVLEEVRVNNGLLSQLVRGQSDLLKDLFALQEQLLSEISSHGAPPFSRLAEDHPCPIDDQSATLRDLLVYRSQWLPLLYRDEEMNRLCEFLNSEHQFSWWALVGDGGVGKSRLALELVRLAREWGWEAGFLADPYDLATGRLHEWRPTVDTLLVMDYATTQKNGPAAALDLMAMHCDKFKGRLRVLLVARPNTLPSMLNAARLDHDYQKDTKRRARLHLFQRQEQSVAARSREFKELDEALRLGGVQPERWGDFLRTVTGKREGSSVALPSEWADDAGRVTDNGRPLLLTLLGLHYSRTDGEPIKNATIDDLLDEVIEFEVHQRWHRTLQMLCEHERVRQPDNHAWKLLPSLQQIIAITTLCNGLDLEAEREALIEAVGLGDEDALLVENAVRQLLGTGEQGRLRALEPALIASRFLVSGGCMPQKKTSKRGKLASPPVDTVRFVKLAERINPLGVMDRLSSMNSDYPAIVAPWIAERFSDPADEYLPSRLRWAVEAIKSGSDNQDFDQIEQWADDLERAVKSLPPSAELRQFCGPLLAELRDIQARNEHPVVESAIRAFENLLVIGA